MTWYDIRLNTDARLQLCRPRAVFPLFSVLRLDFDGLLSAVRSALPVDEGGQLMSTIRHRPCPQRCRHPLH